MSKAESYCSRHISAYVVFECYRNNKIPIKSVTVTSVAGSAAVASIQMHPNPWLLKLTRGINVFVVCRVANRSVHVEPKDYVMFIGDISSIQSSTTSDRGEYIINLVDNRRYVNELPTFYLKLLSLSQGNVLDDSIAEARFYGVPVEYNSSSNEFRVIDIDQDTYTMSKTNGKLYNYIDILMSPLKRDKGWENYYINMNKKKRIIPHTTVVDIGLFRSELTAGMSDNLKAEAISALNDVHINEYEAYDDVMDKLSEIGYIYNTNVFPCIVGWTKDLVEDKDIVDDVDIIYQIKSLATKHKLLDVITRQINKDGEPDIPITVYPASEWIASGSNAKTTIIDNDAKGVDIERNGIKYTAVYLGGKYGSEADKDKVYINEFGVIPKLYGVLPPICNWGVLSEGMTFSCVLNEPPITALKYSLSEDGAYIYSCSYPGSQLVYPMEGHHSGGGGKTDLPAREGKLIEVAPWHNMGDDALKHSAREGHAPSGATDFTASHGTPVYCLAGGTLVKYDDTHDSERKENGAWVTSDKNLNGGYGNYVRIRTRGEDGYDYYWTYAHLKQDSARKYAGYYMNYVIEGENTKPAKAHQYVPAGAIIGEVGTSGRSTGPHLHVDVTRVVGGKASIHVNTTALFNLNDSERNKHIRGINYAIEGKVLKVGIEQIATDIYVGAKRYKDYVIASGKEQIEINNPSGINTIMDINSNGVHYNNEYASEDIYGLKRVSVKEMSLKLINRIMSNDNVSRQSAMMLLEAKVRQDFHESRVSRNTGTITIQGLNENVVVGFPYFLWNSNEKALYYGYVSEVSHRIDNSAATSYTEIVLSNLTITRSIVEIEEMFAGYVGDKFIGKEGLENLNKIYYRTTQTLLTESDYDLFNSSETLKSNCELINDQAQTRMPLRSICTLEQAQNLYYGSETTVPIHNDVADRESKSNQWITRRMHEAINEVITYYMQNLVIGDTVSLSPIGDHPSDTSDQSKQKGRRNDMVKLEI